MSGSMKETAQEETAAARSTDAGRSDHASRRKLFVMRCGARLFAVYQDEVEATSENLTPTPLPFAPAPVRGVVSQRGRILTLIDPLPLLPNATSDGAPPLNGTPPPSNGAQTLAPPALHTAAPFVVVALKGDEQLALSVEAVEREIELYDTEADSVPVASRASLLRRTIPYDGRAVALLDSARLFDAAMQGVERRRQRT